MLKSCHVSIYTIFMFFAATSAMASSGWLVFYESGFRGKVVDAETRGPIEGAVVVAIYNVVVLGPGDSGSVISDVQETLTDSNGEYYIPGNFFFNPWPFTLGGDDTDFIIFKPGYEAYPGNYSFLIFPVKEGIGPGRKTTKNNAGRKQIVSGKEMTNKDEGKLKNTSRLRRGSMATENTREGIVFKKNIKDKEEWKLYKKKFEGALPFIPLKDPFEKVRNLDLPFDTDVFNAEQTYRTSYGKYFKNYLLIGLSRVKTMEERKKSRRGVKRNLGGFDSNAPIFKKMLNDEYNLLIKGVR